MITPEPFDIVELLVNLPEHNLFVGAQGAIVERYSDQDFEVEFSNEKGETLALCTLPSQSFIVVWQSATQQWVSVSEKIAAIINQMPERQQEEILNYARFLYQKA
ncbi:DUF4926 domain-containing protein [Trichothermofontia sp.]